VNRPRNTLDDERRETNGQESQEENEESREEKEVLRSFANNPALPNHPGGAGCFLASPQGT
jgi:hypothetical protein